MKSVRIPKPKKASVPKTVSMKVKETKAPKMVGFGGGGGIVAPKAGGRKKKVM